MRGAGKAAAEEALALLLSGEAKSQAAAAAAVGISEGRLSSLKTMLRPAQLKFNKKPTELIELSNGVTFVKELSSGDETYIVSKRLTNCTKHIVAKPYPCGLSVVSHVTTFHHHHVASSQRKYTGKHLRPGTNTQSAVTRTRTTKSLFSVAQHTLQPWSRPFTRTGGRRLPPARPSRRRRAGPQASACAGPARGPRAARCPARRPA